MNAVQIQLRAQAVGIIAFVGEKLVRPGLAKHEQVRRGGDVGGLARRQMQGKGQSIRIRQDVNLGRDPATGSAQGIQMNTPFPASALCWCAPSRACKHALPGNGITVLSIIWIVRSPAPLATSDSRVASSMPASRHRANLRPTLAPFAEALGQVAPVRAIQRMSSSTQQLSIEHRQARRRSGGRSGAISARVASSIRSRVKAGFQFSALNHGGSAMEIPFVHTAYAMLGASAGAQRAGFFCFNRLRGLMRRFSSNLRVMRLMIRKINCLITRIIDALVAPHMILCVLKI